MSRVTDSSRPSQQKQELSKLLDHETVSLYLYHNVTVCNNVHSALCVVGDGGVRLQEGDQLTPTGFKNLKFQPHSSIWAAPVLQ